MVACVAPIPSPTANPVLTATERARAAGKRRALAFTPEYQRAAGQRRAQQFTPEYQSAAGKLGAQAVADKYGAGFLQELLAAKRLADPTRPERQLRAALLAIGLLPLQDFWPERSVSVYDTVGKSHTYAVDVALSGHRCCEADGFWHTTERGRQHDAVRDAALQAAGWTILRLSDRTLADHEAACQLLAAWLDIPLPAVIPPPAPDPTLLPVNLGKYRGTGFTLADIARQDWSYVKFLAQKAVRISDRLRQAAQALVAAAALGVRLEIPF